MQNLRAVRCRKKGCTVSASFAFLQGAVPHFCAAHKLEGMTSTKKKRCQYQDCSTTPSFALMSDTLTRYCATHRQPGMTNQIANICKHPACGKYATFSLQGKSPFHFCGPHKQPGMEAAHNKVCRHTGCNVQASFASLEEPTSRFCRSHMQNGMTYKKRSDNHTPCPLSVHATRRSEERQQQLSPISPKYKEHCVMTHIRRTFASEVQHMRFNSPIKLASKHNMRGFRPDLYWDLITHGLIVEVDEYQHGRYNIAAQLKRTTQLQVDAQKPVVFLRFNPDGYIDSNDVWQHTCFSRTGVDETKETLWRQRLTILCKHMIACQAVVPLKPVTVLKLFFNERNERLGLQVLTK